MPLSATATSGRVVFYPDQRRHWHTTGHTSATGTAYVNQVRYPARELSALVDAAFCAGRAGQLLSTLNGFFAVCCVDERGRAFAAVDRARSIPMFYAVSGGELYLSDNACWISQRIGSTMVSREAATDLLMTAFVTGSNTLTKEVKQLQLGEMLDATAEEAGWCVKSSYHYHYHHECSTDRQIDSQIDKLRTAVDSAARRLVDYAQGRQILLALSGGLDSTMIGAALRRIGYDNVRAFTYGSRYSREVLHSREVAQRLGFAWDSWLYTAERWRRWLGSNDRRKYWERAHNQCSLPHVQDAMAVAGLLESGFAAPDAVVVPGQSVEGFYGIQFAPDDWAILNNAESDPKAIADLVYRLHYRLWPGELFGPDNREEMHRVIVDSLGERERYGSPTSYFEAWVVREKDGKFNNNSVRAYEHYGLDWWLPLYDNDVISFWTQLPSGMRHGRSFTREFVTRHFRDTTGWEYDYRHGLSGYERAARRFRPMMWRGGWPAALYLALKRELKYNRDRMGWHQIIPRSMYRRLFHFRFNINSLLVLELLGALDLGLGRVLPAGLALPEEIVSRISKKAMRNQDAPAALI